MTGTLKVDFAGTPEEAKEYAKKNGLKYALGLNKRHQELPMLSIPYLNFKEREAAYTLLDSLGWDRDSVMEVSR